MRNKRFIIGIFVCVISLAAATAVMAGSSFDYGDVPGSPALGNVNWTAWLSNGITAGNYPSQVMTEDSTNSSLGVNQGYAIFGGVVRWVMIASNFNAPAATSGSSVVTINLGGLNTNAGSLWQDSFTWSNATSSTNQGTASAYAGTAPCPTITSASASGSQQTINWTGPNGNYHIYRSLNSSGAGNGASNGRYLYLASTNVPAGSGTWVDTYSGQAWYMVIHAASGGAIDGCHSEEAAPTAVAMAGFSATAQPAVPSALLEWQTINEMSVLGFNLYRADTPGGARQQINQTLIPAKQPGQLWGDSYAYEDTTVTLGNRYYYWVEAVKQSGPAEEQGPQTILLGQELFLPVVRK